MHVHGAREPRARLVLGHGAGGGGSFHRIPCLNASPAWVSALGQIVAENLQGWPVRVAAPAETAA